MRSSARSTSASTPPTTTRASRRSSATAVTSTGRTRCRLCLEHPAHPDYFVDKLWSYFVPTPAPAKTRRALKRMYRVKKGAVRPLVEAILMHPELYYGPRMVKPPIVQIAGLMRGRRTGIKSEDWTWIADQAGQRLFEPPNVSGWDETRWLDTARISGRWSAGAELAEDGQANPDNDSYDAKESAPVSRPQGAPLLGRSDDLGGDPQGAVALRPRRREGGDGRLGAVRVPGPAPERAADADRQLPRLPDLMSGMPRPPGTPRACCAEHTRAELARRGLAEAGQGLPSIERGDAAARRHRALPALVAAACRWFGADRLWRRACSRRRRSRRGSRGRRPRRARRSSRSSSTAASTRSRSSPPSTTPATGSSAQSSG